MYNYITSSNDISVIYFFLQMCTFSSNKIGGLVYTNRRMQVARQGLEGALIDEGYKAPLFLNRGNLGNGLYTRELYSNLTVPGNPTATLSNVLNNVTRCV